MSWKEVKYKNVYPKMYEVNEFGVIRRVLYFGTHESDVPRILIARMTGGGQVSINLLTNEKKRIVAPVARIVAVTFHHEEYERLLPVLGRRLICLHRDGDTRNNNASNLYWGTLSEIKHKVSTYTKLNTVAIIALDTERSPVTAYQSIEDAAWALHLSDSGIYRAINDGFLCGGYYWRRVPMYKLEERHEAQIRTDQ